MKDIKKYIQFQKGNIPLIISIPHGGTVKIDSIPNRKNGIRGIDKATIQLGRDLIAQIEQIFCEKDHDSNTPYYVISKVHRAQIDFNREEKKAYQKESEIAARIYSLYHKKLREYISGSIKKFGRAILIDIHGYETNNRPKGFRDVDIVLGTNNLKSIYSKRRPKKKNWDKNIRGRIIERLGDLGVPIAPGLSRRREYVLKGGFITQTYGASEIENCQALQMEFSERIRLYFHGDLRTKILHSLAELIIDEIISKERKR